MNDIEKIEKIRERILSSETRKSDDKNVMYGFCVLKENGNVKYVPYTDPNFRKVIAEKANSDVLCTSCKNCYAHICPKVHATDEKFGKCIEAFSFITDGAQLSPGIAADVFNKYFFIVSGCTNYEKDKGDEFIPFGYM